MKNIRLKKWPPKFCGAGMWTPKVPSLHSSIFLPSSLRKAMASLPKIPDVSIPTGTKRWVRLMFPYFWSFEHSVLSATAPDFARQKLVYNEAKVSWQVASQTRTFPDFHGITVIPLGCLPSSRSKPGDSRCEWILVEPSDLLVMSFVK